MKLFIPSLGTKLVLRQPFTFKLYDEHRNTSFWDKFHGKSVKGHVRYSWDRERQGPISTTLPAGTVLSVSRIFIRAGAKDFDSITFSVVKTKGISVPTGRFWVKLADVNDKLDADVIDEANPYPNGKFVLYIAEEKPARRMVWASEPPTFHQLTWVRNPFNRYSGGFGIKRDVEKDTIQQQRGTRCPYGYMYKVYKKDFPNIEELKAFSHAKGFSWAHISEFENAYKETQKPVVKEEK